jgi:hypothetical protein
MGFALLNGAFLAACSIGHSCTEMGCAYPARTTVKTDVPASLETMRASTLTACWNDDCRSLSLAMLSIVPEPSQFPSGDNQPVNVVLVSAGGKQYLNVQFVSGSQAAAHDGDRFRVTMKDASGAELLSIDDKLAHYSASTPNGPDCEPVCYDGTIDKRSSP